MADGENSTLPFTEMQIRGINLQIRNAYNMKIKRFKHGEEVPSLKSKTVITLYFLMKLKEQHDIKVIDTMAPPTPSALRNVNYLTTAARRWRSAPVEGGGAGAGYSAPEHGPPPRTVAFPANTYRTLEMNLSETYMNKRDQH